MHGSRSTFPTTCCSLVWGRSSRTAGTAACITPSPAECRSSLRAARRTRRRCPRASPGAVRDCACAECRRKASALPSGGFCTSRPSVRTPRASARRSPRRRGRPASNPSCAVSSRAQADPTAAPSASQRKRSTTGNRGTMNTDQSAVSKIEELRGRLHGELHLPGEAGWDGARGAWQLLADQRPDAVVEAADVHDVVEAVRAARALGLGVAPQSTGHAAGTLPGLAGTILLRTSRLDDVSIDPVAGTARVEAGARWGAVAAGAAAHGLAPVAGMAAGVGVVGLLLGGGLGWFARSHGLASNAVIAVEAVDAQGRMLTIDEHRHPELL